MHALNFCMLLPGPEAQQLATYLGWRLHGWKGGVAAGGLFVLPSAFLLFLLSWLFLAGGQVAWMAAIFHGLLPAVIAVIFVAVLNIGGNALRSPVLLGLAVTSFVAIYLFSVSFVLIVLCAAVVGWVGHYVSGRQFPALERKRVQDVCLGEQVLKLPDAPQVTWKRSLLICAICVALWAAPILLLGMWLGWESTPVGQGLFFSKAALVTFGGAYAVLPYVAQQAVESYGWLTHSQMMSGLALAETTPGPLVIVLQFVGFVGGWQNPGELSPLLAASIGALITTWTTFLPCFLFVFLGGPYVEGLRERPQLGACLQAITAAVVGVILNLGVVFAEHALWQSGGGFDLFVGIFAAGGFLVMWIWKVPFTMVLAVCAVAGLANGLLPWGAGSFGW